MIVPRISVTPAAFQKRSIIGQYLGPGTYVGGKDPMQHLLFRDLCGLSTEKNWAQSACGSKLWDLCGRGRSGQILVEVVPSVQTPGGELAELLGSYDYWWP